MPQFRYKARTAEGKPIEGEMDAPSENELAKQLKEKGYIPTKIKPANKEAPAKQFGKRLSHVKSADMILFNTQLANLISAGVPILTSLNTLAQVIVNKRLREAVERVKDQIAAGRSFSEALIEQPKVFPHFFVSMVKAGEAGGHLSLSLSRYAQYIERKEEIRQKIMNALLYPALLLIFGAGAVIYILAAVIPKFVEIFVRTGVELPLPTKILFNMGQFFNEQWIVLLAGILIVTAGVAAVRRSGPGKDYLDGLELRLPVIGPLKRRIYVSRFCRSLATLLESGVSLQMSLSITEDAIGNSRIARAIEEAKTGIEQGETLSEPIRQSRVFPEDVVQMITVGEESGELNKMLSKVADFYDVYLDHTIKRLIVLIEPVLIIVMAALIGMIMASVILPLFDMVKTIR